eukprot:SAG31_NODE_15006_length_776_cov_0.911374_1_plen_181_part_00
MFSAVPLLVAMVASAAAAQAIGVFAPYLSGQFVTCPACTEDAGVWYYKRDSQLFYVDINWPKPWKGACPAEGVPAIKPLLQAVSPATIAGLAGRLAGGSGSPCSPPCQHFNCSFLSLSPHSMVPPAPPPPPPAPVPADEWARLYRNWTYYPEWAIPPSCVDPSTCPMVRRNFTDIAQAWR